MWKKDFYVLIDHWFIGLILMYLIFCLSGFFLFLFCLKATLSPPVWKHQRGFSSAAGRKLRKPYFKKINRCEKSPKQGEVGIINKHDQCLDRSPDNDHTLVTNVVKSRVFSVLGSFLLGFCCWYSVCILKIGQVMSFVLPLLMEAQELCWMGVISSACCVPGNYTVIFYKRSARMLV